MSQHTVQYRITLEDLKYTGRVIIRAIFLVQQFWNRRKKIVRVMIFDIRVNKLILVSYCFNYTQSVAPSQFILLLIFLFTIMPYLYLKRVNHDLHQHLLIRKQTVQIQTLTLHSLQNNKYVCL